jgi:hypothetical protein
LSFPNSKSSEKKVIEIIKLVFISLSVIAILLLYSANYSRSVLDTLVTISKHQQYSSNASDFLILKYEEKLKSQNSFNDELEELDYRISSIISLIDNTKLELIAASDGGNELEDKSQYPDLILGKDNVDVTNFIMIGEKVKASSKRAAELKNQLRNLQGFIISFNESSGAPVSEDAIKQIEDLLHTENVMAYNGSRTWEEHMFYNVPLIGAIAILNSIQNDVKTVELIFKSELTYSLNAS